MPDLVFGDAADSGMAGPVHAVPTDHQQIETVLDGKLTKRPGRLVCLHHLLAKAKLAGLATRAQLARELVHHLQVVLEHRLLRLFPGLGMDRPLQHGEDENLGPELGGQADGRPKRMGRVG